MSARDEAAKRYVHPLDATPLTTTADRRVEDFKAGWDAALAEPSDAEVEAAYLAYWTGRPARDDDGYLHGIVRDTLTAFLTARKGKTQ